MTITGVPRKSVTIKRPVHHRHIPRPSLKIKWKRLNASADANYMRRLAYGDMGLRAARMLQMLSCGSLDGRETRDGWPKARVYYNLDQGKGKGEELGKGVTAPARETANLA